MAPSAIPPKRVLPSKEAALFKELLSFYENRQLKKGLKTADQILKKFPEHGETTCMKGLVLTHMGKREEGIDLVKKGVRLDLTSHICWHVFGLIQKGEKNYEEALKSYLQALKFDKENLNILRDAAQLQTQLRQYDSLVETRYTLLKSRANLRQHWIAMAVAYHLSGNLPQAAGILEHYEGTLKDIPPYDTDHSETLLYHIRILEEMGSHEQALALLDVNAKSRAIVDRTSIMEIRARLLTSLASPEASDAWRALIEHNADCYDYYYGFLGSVGIDLKLAQSEESNEKALQILQSFSTQIPRATAPKRLALTVASGEAFETLATPYLLSALKKGIPSLFADIKALCASPSKRLVVQSIVESFRSQLESSAETSTDNEPTTYLWTLYFLAQHYAHPVPEQNLPKSLELLQTALTHTPTLPELHTLRARVLKRAGDFVGAAMSMEEARMLDGQDRFLNTKCGKYFLRAGWVGGKSSSNSVEGGENELPEAQEIFGLFTKKDTPTPGHDLEDMQSLLYLVEEGDAWVRKGRLGLALKRFVGVEKVFNEIEDDQYDFHGYSIRRFTINIYISLLKWEDTARSHPAYIKAALSAVKIYVAVHDDPAVAVSASEEGQLSGAEKKAKKKAKKASQKAQEEPKKAAAPSANEDKGLEPQAPTDDDPDGTKLLGVKDPLEKAAKLLSPLIELVPEHVGMWLSVYDVAVRRRKLLQAAKALNRVKMLDPESPELHIRLIEFKKIVTSLPQPPPTPIGPILLEALASLVPAEVSLETLNSQYLQTHAKDPRAVIAGAEAAKKLGAPREEVEDIIFGLFSNTEIVLDIKSAITALDFLQSIKSPRTTEYRSACDARFEFSTVFKDSSELDALRKKLSAGLLDGQASGLVEVVS